MFTKVSKTPIDMHQIYLKLNFRQITKSNMYGTIFVIKSAFTSKNLSRIISLKSYIVQDENFVRRM